MSSSLSHALAALAGAYVAGACIYAAALREERANLGTARWLAFSLFWPFTVAYL